MERIRSIVLASTPDRLWQFSSFLLIGGLVFFISVLLVSTWLSTAVLIVLLAGLVGGLAVGLLLRDEVALLCAILVGFIAAAHHQAGFQAEEILYGLFYLSYLFYWYVSRLFFYRDKIFRTPVDWSIFLFLVYVTASLALTPLLGGEISAAVSEWLSISMLAFYFPIKELCIRKRDRLPHRPILFSLALVALFIAIRNFAYYRRGLAEAEYLWQIATGRVVLNEHVLLLAAVASLAFMVSSQKKYQVLGFALLFMTYGAGVLIGQSRAVWVSLVLGITIVFVLVDRRKRLQIAAFGSAGLACILVIGSVYFQNFFTLIFAGLADRLFSLRTAVVEDISLINRFVEIQAAWEYIKQNPIIGHGFGVPIQYYSLVFEATRINSFIHNGFVGVWYRHGLIGFALLYFYYFGSIWLAYRAAKLRPRLKMEYVIAIAAVACLIAESLAGTTENPFATSDKTFMIAAITGLSAASYHEARKAKETA